VVPAAVAVVEEAIAVAEVVPEEEVPVAEVAPEEEVPVAEAVLAEEVPVGVTEVLMTPRRLSRKLKALNLQKMLRPPAWNFLIMKTIILLQFLMLPVQINLKRDKSMFFIMKHLQKEILQSR